MARRVSYTEEMILDAARVVKAQGKKVNAWSVRTEMGGGKVSRIENILAENEVSVIDAEPAMDQQVLTLPSQFAPQVEQMQQAMHTAACDMWRAATEMADNRVRDEFVAAKTARDTAERELSEARQAVDQQEDELEQLDKALESSNHSNSNLQADLQESRERAAASDTEVRTLKDQLTELRKEHDALEQANKQLEKDHHKTTEKLSSLSETHKTTLNHLKQERSQHQVTKDAVLELTKVGAELNATLASRDTSLTEKDQRIRELATESGELKQENKALNKHSGEVQGQLDASKHQVAELTQKTEALHSELQANTKASLATDYSLKQAREEIEVLQGSKKDKT